MNPSIRLGSLIWRTQRRDAVHIAIAPVVAQTRLMPGEHIGFMEEGNTELVGTTGEFDVIGVVDPFLRAPVSPGDSFWMFLYPNTVVSLRHDWTHPAFSQVAPEERLASQAWLGAMAHRADMSYEELIGHVRRFLRDGDPFIEIGSETLRDMVEADRDSFWDHYEKATGMPVPAEDRGESPFVCSC
jgi:hypothetical protein